MFPLRIHEDDDVTLMMPFSDSTIGNVSYETIRPHPMSTGILPPVTRYLSPARNILIFDRPPHPVTIKYYGKKLNKIDADTTMYEFDVYLPWTLYAVYLSGNTISNVYLYGLDGPFRQGIYLRLLPIPNYYLDGRFCIPDQTYHFTSVADAMSTAYNIIWDSNFNIDVTEVSETYYKEQFGVPGVFWNYVHEKDAARRSVAGLLKAFSKMGQDEVLEMSSDLMVSSVNTVQGLPSMADVVAATPDMFAAHVNQSLS